VTVTGQVSTINTDTAAVVSDRYSRYVGRGTALGNGSALGIRSGTAGAVPGGIGAGVGGGVGGGVFAIPAAAAARELGDLFEYKLKSPISIQKNRSALVPIVQSAIAAEKISVWNERSGLPRPARALWLTNSSGLTLDGGSFSVLENETFAGEGVFDPIRPGEKRIVSYAIDLALNASSKNTAEPQHITHVHAIEGVMIQEAEVRERRVYTFRNEDSAVRRVIVEHPVRAGYTLRSESKPVEITADWMRFRLEVAPKQSAVLAVEETRPVETRYLLTNLTRDQVELFVRQRSIDHTVEEALRRILAQKEAMVEIESRKDARDEEMKGIFDDQQRLRENMKSLKGSAEEKQLILRYTGQLSSQESRLEKLREEIAKLETEKDAAEESLAEMIRRLAFDVRM
jgi:hypothetical protein